MSDRSGVNNSAIMLSGGYLIVPGTLYFNGDYSISAWIYETSYVFFGRLLESMTQAAFSHTNTVELILSQNTYGNTYMVNVNGTSYKSCNPPAVIPLKTWTHIAYTMSGTTMTFYLNGAANYSCSGMMQTAYADRTNSYIGYNVANGNYLSSGIDSMMIFNRALTATEVSQVMNAF